MVGGHVLPSKQKFAAARRHGTVAEDMLVSCTAFATSEPTYQLELV